MRKEIIKRDLLPFVLMLLLSLPFVVLGQDPEEEFINIIDNITVWLQRVLIAFAVLMTVYSALKIMLSGSPDDFSKAKNSLLYIAVAVAIAILAGPIVATIKSLVQ